MTKIVITNQVALNAGDAAILYGVVEAVRSAFGSGAEIVVIDRNAPVSARHYPDLRFRQMYRGTESASVPARAVRRALGKKAPLRVARALHGTPGLAFALPRVARRNLDEFRSADLVISTGGTYLVDHYDPAEKLFQLELAGRSGRPAVLFTQSLGPFRRAATRAALKRIVPRLALVLLRDRLSRTHLEELGVALPETRVVADAVFGLADSATLRSAATRSLGSPLTVAVSVREWKFPGLATGAAARSTYHDWVRAALSWLVAERGARIRFVSTCQGIAEYRLKDSLVAQEIAAGLPDEIRSSVTVDHDFHTPQQLVDLYGSHDLVIATRMHSAILALIAGTPVLPIAYEFKTTELFANLGFGDWVQDIAALDPREAGPFVARALDQLPGRRAALMEAVERQRASARSVIPLLRDLVGAPPPPAGAATCA